MATKDAKILIKRGLEANLPTTGILAGELLLTSDKGKLYYGTGLADPNHVKPINSDTAEEAIKLVTARQIALSGDVTGSASFDGSTNATIAATLANSGVTAGTYTKVTVDAKGRVTAGEDLTITLDANKIVITDASGELDTSEVVTLTELAALVGVSNTKTIQQQIDAIKLLLDAYVEIENLPDAIGEFSVTQTSSAISLNSISVCTVDGTTTPAAVTLQTASASQIGLMPASSYAALQQAVADIELLKGATKTYFVDLTGAVDQNEPTEQELQDAYEAASGEVGQAPDGVIIRDADTGLSWQWSDTSNKWVSISTPSVGLATQSAPGIVQGSNAVGQIFVETNGTMSLNGFDALVPKITTVAGKALSSNVSLDKLTIINGKDASSVDIVLTEYDGSAAKKLDLAPVLEAALDNILTDLDDKVDKIDSADEDNVVVFDDAGGIKDSGIAISDVVLQNDIIDGGTF